MTSRRDFLHTLTLLGLGAGGGPVLRRLTPRWAADPFTLGVASGDPWSDGFVLWTRLAPDPVNGGGMPVADIPVRWEVATDEGMRRVVRRGTGTATPGFAHSVHVELRGLDPDRWYWYRFMTGEAATAVGRARTMPREDASPERMRMAFASCQHYEWGYFAAHRHLAQEDVDLVCFLGDYMYEGHAARAVRQHESDEPMTLAAYRNRYAHYKRDEHLQAAHAACPWVVTWDDHEVDNNYAGLVSEQDDPVTAFAIRRAAAYRAYYEHMPVRRHAMPHGPDALLYRRINFGRLATFHVLDGRQYRSDQACGDRRKAPCAEWGNAERTMLGDRQERWLGEGLAASRSTWNVLGNQVVMMPLDLDPGPGEMYNMDSWSGYPAARQRLVSLIAERRVPNVVTITGDVHANYAGLVPRDPRAPDGDAVAVEYVGTSMTSDGDGSEAQAPVLAIMPSNPNLKYHNNRRGYVRCEITRDAWRADYRVLPNVQSADAGIATHASFVTPHGASRIERA